MSMASIATAAGLFTAMVSASASMAAGGEAGARAAARAGCVPPAGAVLPARKPGVIRCQCARGYVCSGPDCLKRKTQSSKVCFGDNHGGGDNDAPCVVTGYKVPPCDDTSESCVYNRARCVRAASMGGAELPADGAEPAPRAARTGLGDAAATDPGKRATGASAAKIGPDDTVKASTQDLEGQESTGTAALVQGRAQAQARSMPPDASDSADTARLPELERRASKLEWRIECRKRKLHLTKLGRPVSDLPDCTSKNLPKPPAGRAVGVTGPDSGGASTPTSTRPRFRRGVVMSCPHGHSQHNPGSWKPAMFSTGIEAVAAELSRHKSSLVLVVTYFAAEAAVSEPFCRELADRYHATLNISCFAIARPLPYGYGVPKIFAIEQAPVEQALWLDCDAFPTRDLAYLFDDPNFRQTGAMFWPDVESHFHWDRVKHKLAADNPGYRATFPDDQWWTVSGFDSGVLLIDKTKVRRELARLGTMASNFSAWEKMTGGDKDLWHIAWMLEGTNYTLVPYVGSVGSFISDKFYMASQVLAHLSQEAHITE